MILVECNSVQLLWVLGHKGAEGNETADQLAKRSLLHPFIGPEPACGISDTVTGRVFMDWVHREHQEYNGSLFQNKGTQKAFFLGSLLRGHLRS
jgi:hypothetical protein